MREIKFRQRVKGIKGSENRKDNWHYWGFIDKGFIGPALGTMTIEEAKKNSQEYTGLKDKNGKEIYEGDIIEDYWNAKCLRTRLVIKWNNFGWSCYKPSIDKYYDMDNSIGKFEVIGNIYEDTI